MEAMTLAFAAAAEGVSGFWNVDLSRQEVILVHLATTRITGVADASGVIRTNGLNGD